MDNLTDVNVQSSEQTNRTVTTATAAIIATGIATVVLTTTTIQPTAGGVVPLQIPKSFLVSEATG